MTEFLENLADCRYEKRHKETQKHNLSVKHVLGNA